MTNGSSHSRWESNVHTWLNPASSAWRASSTTRHAGGLVWRTTPKLPRSQRVLGKPRSTVLVAGSGQRDVTTLVRV